MVEWGTTPDYIVNNWTDELLELMVSKLVERKQRETEIMHPEKQESKVSDEMLFNQLGKNMKRKNADKNR